MSWAKLLAGLVSLFNRFFQNQRDNELRKDGAREADLARRDKIDAVEKEAKKVRRRPVSRSKPDVLERL